MAQKDSLSAHGLASFMESVRREHGRVEELTTALSERGFRAVVEDMFELSEYQRARLDAMMTPEFEAICRDACLIALKTGGSIMYSVTKVKDGGGPRPMRADVECEGDLDELHAASPSSADRVPVRRQRRVYAKSQTAGRPFRMNTHAMGRPDMSCVSPRATSSNPLAL